MSRINEIRQWRKPGSLNLAYLCLQVTREGQASYAHVHEIIKGLKKRGWRVQLYEPLYGRRNSPGALTRLLEFIRVQIKLWFSGRPQILYIRHHFAALPTAIWARLFRLPVVQEVNGPYEDLFIAWPFTRRVAWLFKWMTRLQLRWADVVIAVTPQLAEWVKKESGNPEVYIVPNGANTDLFSPDAPLITPRALPNTFVVFFGTLARWQGIDTMLKAIDSPEWPSGVKLVILGRGAEQGKVNQAALQGKVIYLGEIPYREVPGIVARSITALSPKNNQGGRSETGLFPLKVFEALACGVPVIVTDFPGMADLVKASGCGIVIPPDDPEALAKAVRYIYNHPTERLRMGCVGRELVVKEHSWDNRAGLTHRILAQILREQAGERLYD